MKISVILTSYNHEKFLRESIDSVLEQTYRDFEFIIVDDCSQDSSWNIICEYKKKYPEIIAIRHEFNWGGGIIPTTVKDYATGDYIAIHHSDDIWELDKLEKQVKVIKDNPQYVAVFTNAQAIDDDGNDYNDEKGFYYNLFHVENRSRQKWLNYFFYHGNCLCHPSILARRDVYTEVAMSRVGFQQIPDFIIWIRTCMKNEIYVLPDTLVKFRIHAEGKNTSGMRSETQIRSSIELFLMLDEYTQIKERDEFLSVFPEAEIYCEKEAFIPEYAFGRLCTQKEMPNYTRLYGVQLLYKVLNQSKQRETIKKTYHYTEKNFKLDNGKYDIFGVIPDAFEQIRSIYIDTGSGFNVNEMYREKFTFRNEEKFEWTCSIEISEGYQLRKLRFDPAEGVMVKVKLDNVRVNGIDTDYQGYNDLCTHDGEQFFVSLDPIYYITVPDEIVNENNIVVTISGKIERLTKDEINNTVAEIKNENNQKSEEITRLTYEINKMSEEQRIVRNTWAYRLANKICHRKE